SFQITFNGKENKIFNGVPDWVYEEEMLATKYALWWSPNGKFLAYAEFNDTEIPVIAYSYYGDEQYPRTINIPYPKAGAKNPVVRVFIIDATYPDYVGPREVPVPAIIASSDYYFSWLTWVTDDRICLQWLKRIQNVSVLSICDFREDWQTWDCPKVGYMKTTEVYFEDESTKVGTLQSQNFSLVLFSFSSRISIGGYPPRKKCVTCHLRKERCQYYTASFSDYAKYYALVCYGRSSLWYKMILPPQFDKSKKYPLLIQVYGGPCSQSVRSIFAISWISYLASKEGIVIALVDGRGTAFQGDKLLYAVYRKLGVYEVEDQITAVRKFIEMGFIDEKRIAIWGWSYGGYVSSLALASGTGLFKCGIAVAPVSSWEYYASIYTERFMGLPTKDDNLKHYKNSTVMARAEYFRNVDYLLIHGTADDNVHFQNSAQIAKALVNAQVDFQAMWYSDQNHGISGLSTKHLYTHMTHFLKQCFSLSD
uniref:Fibroblast activation protein alpha n=1 Tax=Equus asinus asinus TaxID=83772 RepID=A0A8C4MZW2_EQUAS